MKFKLIIPFLFPLFLSAQNVTFESVFHTVEQTSQIEIYHVKMEINVQNSRIEIYTFKEEAKILTFSFPVSMQTSDNNVYWCSDEYGNSATYTKDKEMLMIHNSIMTWTIYGEIPGLVRINK